MAGARAAPTRWSSETPGLHHAARRRGGVAVAYHSVERLLEVLEDKIVRPAKVKFNEFLARRTNQLRVENV
jgi:hypothetical protein